MAGEQFWLQALYFLQRKNTWLWGWTPKSDTQPTENLFVTTWLMSFAQLWMSFLLFCVVVLFTSINVQFGTVYTPQSDSHWFIAHCCRPWLCYLCISGNFNCISSLTVSSLALAPAYPSHWLSSVHTHTHTVRRRETLHFDYSMYDWKTWCVWELLLRVISVNNQFTRVKLKNNISLKI